MIRHDRQMHIGQVARVILSALAAGGFILIAVTAPNAVQLLMPLVKENRKKLRRQSVERALQRLRDERIVEFVRQKGKVVLQVTEKGQRRYRELEFENMILEIPKTWDRLWTVILYDIPEKKKIARDALRHKLRQLGCYQYHKSVFVHPVDCGDEIDFVTTLFGVENFVAHFRASELGSQEYRALRHFELVKSS